MSEKPNKKQNPVFSTPETSESSVAGKLDPKTWIAKLRGTPLAGWCDVVENVDRFVDDYEDPFLVTDLPTTFLAAQLAVVIPIAPRDKAGPKSLGALGSRARTVQVGRTPDNDIPIPCPTVSKRHALFTRGAAGWSLADLNTTNGTTLDGRRLEAGELVVINTTPVVVTFGPDVSLHLVSSRDLAQLVVKLRNS